MKRKIGLKEISCIDYNKPEIKNGYSDHFLSVDLSAKSILIDSVPDKVKNIFTGGKGYDLWRLWNSVEGNTEWFYPENAICIASGPLGGTPIYPGSGKSIVTTISPLTGSVIDSNVGGHFGPFLKFSGFDVLEIKGKSEVEVVVFIDGVNGRISIFDINNLPEESHELSKILTEHFGQGNQRQISIVSTGPGAKKTKMGCLNFSWFDAKRKIVRYKQAGRGGIGTVFANKNIRALVVRCDSVSIDANQPSNKEALKEVAKKHTQEIINLDPKQNEMAKIGTTHLVTIMDNFDLLPVNNFQFGKHCEAANLGAEVYRRMFDKGFDGCWIGCPVACAHGVKNFVPLTGPYKGQRVFVDGPEYETIAGCGSNLGIFDPHFVVEMNFYCDTYGLDTISIGTSIAFVMECYERGLINNKDTGGLELFFGNKAAVLELLHQMIRGSTGFSVLVGQGIRFMKSFFATSWGADRALLDDIGMESKGLEFSEYISKESLAQQGGYGLALKGAQHDEAWLIFLDSVKNLMPTFEQKAEALFWFPMWRTWFGLCGLCKLPWNDITPLDNNDTPEPAKVMKHVDWYAEFFSAVTGKQVTSEDLILMSERVYNFQRIFNLKMGFGRREHDAIPYRAMGPVTIEEYESRCERYDKQLIEKCGLDIANKTIDEKITLLRQYKEEQYELLKDAVYKRRGWTNDGIPTVETVRRLGIDFPEVLEVLKRYGVE